MLERTISSKIQSLCEDFKVLMLIGARQVGKTTLLRAMKEDGRTYVTLDERLAYATANADTSNFFSFYPLPALIDEIQRAPDLFLEIKYQVDKSDEKNRVWLTGSHKPNLKKHANETLVGRVAEIEMFPLSQAEKQGDPYRPSWYPGSLSANWPAVWDANGTLENVVLGGYPALLSVSPRNRKTWFESYISTYLEGDLKSEGFNIPERSFKLILRSLAARTATSLNVASIASDTGVSVYNVNRLISLLEAMGLIILLPPYSRNPEKALVKTPRLHFTDSGLCCHLLGIRDVAGLRRSMLAGRIFESYAVSEIVKNARNNGDYAHFSFYREESRGTGRSVAEIDLIKESGGLVYPFEIKMSGTPTPEMGRHFYKIPENVRGMGTIVSLADRHTLLKKDLEIVPVSNI